MDFKYIIENNGYGKLAEKLPDYEKGVLEAYKKIIKDLECAFDNYCFDYLDEESKLDEIKKEIVKEFECFLANWLDSEHDELLVSFVEDNDYCIDEKGNIVKEEE